MKLESATENVTAITKISVGDCYRINKRCKLSARNLHILRKTHTSCLLNVAIRVSNAYKTEFRIFNSLGYERNPSLKAAF